MFADNALFDGVEDKFYLVFVLDNKKLSLAHGFFCGFLFVVHNFFSSFVIHWLYKGVELMAKSKDTIIEEIKAYIKENAVGVNKKLNKALYSLWYCGITADKEANYTRHGSAETHKHWLCNSSNISREIEKYFQEKGMQGAPGGGDDPVYVYVLKMSQKRKGS